MTDTLVYAAFWRRLVAGLLDFIVVATLSLALGWLLSTSKAAALVLFIPVWIAIAMYEPYMHSKYGATMGKLLLGIRVVRVDGGKIGWRQALLRSSVLLVAQLIWIWILFPSLASLPGNEFRGQGWAHLFHSMKPAFVAKTDVLDLVLNAWILSEFVTMLFNRQRRAIHDFIAGTVVVKKLSNGGDR